MIMTNVLNVYEFAAKNFARFVRAGNTEFFVRVLKSVRQSSNVWYCHSCLSKALWSAWRIAFLLGLWLCETPIPDSHIFPKHLLYGPCTLKRQTAEGEKLLPYNPGPIKIGGRAATRLRILLSLFTLRTPATIFEDVTILDREDKLHEHSWAKL